MPEPKSRIATAPSGWQGLTGQAFGVEYLLPTKGTRPKWRNRQTRCVQGAVGFMPMWVQLPPSALRSTARLKRPYVVNTDHPHGWSCAERRRTTHGPRTSGIRLPLAPFYRTQPETINTERVWPDQHADVVGDIERQEIAAEDPGDFLLHHRPRSLSTPSVRR